MSEAMTETVNKIANEIADTSLKCIQTNLKKFSDAEKVVAIAELCRLGVITPLRSSFVLAKLLQ